MVRLSRLAPRGRAGFDPRCSNGALVGEGGGRGVRLRLIHVLERQLLLKLDKNKKNFTTILDKI